MSVPTSISGLAVWFDGSDDSTITTSGANVTGWADKSGNGRNAAYYGGAYPTKTNPGIRFNSSLLSLSAPLSNTVTVFMVASPSSTSQCYFFGTDIGGSGPSFIQNYDGNSLEYFNGTERFAFSTNPAQVFLAGFIHNPTTLTGYYQGVSVYSGASSNMNSGTLVVLGAAQLGGAGYINATIYELIVYTSSLSESERKAVESYLQRKYAKLLGLSFDRSLIRGSSTTVKGSNCLMK